MPTSGGGFTQSYNAQSGVDIDIMLVISQHISQKPNDKQEIEPTLKALKSLPSKLGTIDSLLADNGYFCKGNTKSCLKDKIVPYISGRRYGHNRSLKDRFFEPPSVPLPDNADIITEMAYRLKTKAGRELYARRKCTVEPVFGIIKAVMGFRQFLFRGVESVRGEWSLVCMAWNLKRLHVLARASR